MEATRNLDREEGRRKAERAARGWGWGQEGKCGLRMNMQSRIPKSIRKIDAKTQSQRT